MPAVSSAGADPADVTMKSDSARHYGVLDFSPESPGLRIFCDSGEDVEINKLSFFITPFLPEELVGHDRPLLVHCNQHGFFLGFLYALQTGENVGVQHLALIPLGDAELAALSVVPEDGPDE